jgi:hypothetical protein
MLMSIGKPSYIPECFLRIQPAGSASKPKLSASSWWFKGNAQWDVQQMKVR